MSRVKTPHLTSTTHYPTSALLHLPPPHCPSTLRKASSLRPGRHPPGWPVSCGPGATQTNTRELAIPGEKALRSPSPCGLGQGGGDTQILPLFLSVPSGRALTGLARSLAICRAPGCQAHGQHTGPGSPRSPGAWSLNLCLQTLKIPRIGCKRPPQR